MQTPEEIKAMVQQKYAEIALQDKETNAQRCCGAGDCCDEGFHIMADEYKHLEGYVADADLGLGCGLPTEFAVINEGDVVVDLGSGAGNDCFVARGYTGDSGKVIGVDFTPVMIEKARQHAEKLGYSNVSFRLGDIENLPLTANKADVVISNCVLNLVPDKAAAFSEIYRVLKQGGHFCISDIVLSGELPAPIREAAQMYAGCISGALQKPDYMNNFLKAGFVNVKIAREKVIELPDNVLIPYLSETQLVAFRESGTGIFSITVLGTKPVEKACGCGCACN